MRTDHESYIYPTKAPCSYSNCSCFCVIGVLAFFSPRTVLHSVLYSSALRCTYLFMIDLLSYMLRIVRNFLIFCSGNKISAAVEKEIDMSAFIWHESANDLPTMESWVSSSQKTLRDGRGLLMKAHGFTPVVQRCVCVCVTCTVLHIFITHILLCVHLATESSACDSCTGPYIQKWKTYKKVLVDRRDHADSANPLETARGASRRSAAKYSW